MKSEALRIAEIHSRDQLLQSVFSVINNPLVIALGVFIAVEYLQKMPVGEKREPFMGENVGTLLEGAVIATPVLTALANSGTLTAMVKAPVEVLGSLAKLAPLALAA